MQILPVTPEPRVVESHEFKGFKTTLLEQPDLMLERPYQLYSVMKDDDLGHGKSMFSFETQIMAKQIMHRSLMFYANNRCCLDGTDVPAQIVKAAEKVSDDEC